MYLGRWQAKQGVTYLKRNYSSVVKLTEKSQIHKR